MRKLLLTALVLLATHSAQAVLTPLHSGGGGVTPNSCSSGLFANGISDSSGTLSCAALPADLLFTAPLVNTAGTVAIGAATDSDDGYLTSADHAAFAAKQAALTFGDISTSTSGVTVTGGTSSTVGPAVTVDIATASTSQAGLLSTGSQGIGGEKSFNSDVQVTNAPAPGTPGVASQILTGDPNTGGLVIKGSTSSGAGPFTPEADAKFFASYGSTIDADYGGGSLTGTASGGATIVSSALALGANQSVAYSAPGNADCIQTCTIRLNHTPNYTGAPGAPQTLIDIRNTGVASGNRIELVHYTDGSLLFYISDSSGAPIITQQDAGAYSPVAGTTYELEWDFDVTAGVSRYFINGVQAGATATGTGTRSGTVDSFQVGNGPDYGNGSNNASFSNVIIYSTVQHTSNFSGEIPRTYSRSGTVVQASDLQEWQAPSGSVLSSISSNGGFLLNAITELTPSYYSHANGPGFGAAPFIGNISDSDQTEKFLQIGSTDTAIVGNSTSNLYLFTGDATNASGTGSAGDVSITAGSATGASSSGNGGNAYLMAGKALGSGAGAGGVVNVVAGDTTGASNGGDASIVAGISSGGGQGGSVNLVPGTPNGQINLEGPVAFQTGPALTNAPSVFLAASFGSLLSSDLVGAGKAPRAMTVENIEAVAAVFSTCTVNPVVTMYECGTSATCTSPTAIGSVTVTAANTITDGTVSAGSIAAGHYYAFEITAGACASAAISVTAEAAMQ